MKRRWSCIAAASILTVCSYSIRGSDPDLPMLRSTTQDFLKFWYVDRAYGRLMGFIARDNEFAVPEIRSQFRVAEGNSPWMEIFQRAFPSEGPRPASLKEAIQYSYAGREGSNTLSPLNTARGLLVDPFAVVDPVSVPAGSLFPRPDATPGQRERYDAVAKYLDRLRREYKGKMYLVLYATKPPQLLEEGVVLYWIVEGSAWKLAMLQGTD